MGYLQLIQRVRFMQYAATISATLSMTGCGLYAAWSSPTLPKLTSADSPIGVTLTSSEASWVASALILGYIPGGVISGWLLSRFGPKTALLVSALPICLPWLAIIFANSFIVLFVARLIAGIGSSIAATVAPIYNAEVADTDIRGKLGATTSILYYVGCLFVLSLGPFVSYHTLAICCSIFSLSFIGTFWFMPESPYYLVKINRVSDARTNVIRLCAQNADNKLVQVHLDEVTRTIEHNMKNKSTLWELFTNREYTRLLLIMTVVRTVQQFCGVSAIEVYMQTIIESSNSSVSPEHSSIILGVIQMFAAITAGGLVDKLGRKPLLIISALGCALALSAEGTYFYLYNTHGAAVEYLSWLPITGLVIFWIQYPTGLGTLPNVLLGEIFPSNIKEHAVSFFTVIGGVLSALVVLCFDPISTFLGVYMTFFIFATCCVLGAIFIFVVLPETKGKTFVEIQTKFNNTEPI